jgi:AraC-like DNA-binding protein
MHLFINFYLFCLVLAAANLLLAALLLFTLRKARNRKANTVLGILLLALAATFLSDIMLLNQGFQVCPHLLDYDSLLILLYGPLLYGYILHQTRPQFQVRPAHLLHLLPLVGYVILLWDFFTADAATKLAYTQAHDWGAISFILAYYLSKLQLFLYGLACYRLLVHHSRVIRELVSSLEHRQLRWLRHLLVGATVLFFVWILTNELGLPEGLLGAVLLGFSYWLAYHAFSQEYLFANVRTEQVSTILEEAPDVRYRNSTLTPEDLQRRMTQVEQYMREAKPYLDSELTLTTLADALDLNPYYLSQVLNDGFQENFYKFINRYRVEESKQLLLDPAFSHYTILAIANQAGFSAKSTFNKTFKEHTQLSPSEFVKQHRPG